MAKRFVWMGTGYVAGAASSLVLTRKVRNVTEKVVPAAVRGEATERVIKATKVAKTAKAAADERMAQVNERMAGVKDRVRPQAEDTKATVGGEVDAIDLRDGQSETPSLDDVRRQLDVGRITDSAAVARLRERTSRYGRH